MPAITMVPFGVGAPRPIGQLGMIGIAERGDMAGRPRQRLFARIRAGLRAWAVQRRVLGAIRKIGAPLASARSVDELPSLIDQGVSSSELPRMLAAIASHFDLNAVLSEPLDEVADALTHVCGSEASADIERGIRYEMAALGGWLSLVTVVPRSEAHEAREHFGSDHLHLLYDQDVPLVVCEALLGAYRAQVAISGANLALLTRRPIGRDVARELAKIYADGMHLYARFIASMPEARVPIEVVPVEERYDLDALQREHEIFWEGIGSGSVSLGSPDAD